MSLKDVYQRFLADHKSVSLAPDASLIYIPTTTKLEGPDAVIAHLSKHNNIVKPKAQDVLGVVEGADSLCLDVETTLEFVVGGGAYLPSLDDNFLVDRVASFPTVHIVRFNSNKQIQNVRVYWDQASLLRQVEVIGTRGRAWPIREAKDQTRLIKSAIAATPTDVGTASKHQPSDTQDNSNRPGTPSGKRRIRDPYAAESLTDLLSPGNDRTEPVRAPRSAATAKPPQRDLSDLLVPDDDGTDEPPSPSKPAGTVAPKVGAGRNFQHNRLFDDNDEPEEPGSPSKSAGTVAPKVGAGRNFQHNSLFDDNDDPEEPGFPSKSAGTVAPKAGAGRNFQHNSLFDDNDEPEEPGSPSKSAGTVAPKAGAGRNFQHNRLFDDDETVAAEQGGHKQIAYRTNPNRFNHFDIGADNSDREIQDKPAPGRAKSRHTAQWGFDDFVTPEKPRRALRGQEINQFPWSDTEPDKTPQYRQPVVQPRRDAETHFELTDGDDKPKNGRMINSFQNKGLSLYHDPILDGTGDDDEEEKRKQQGGNQPRFSLSSAGANRHKNFDSHWFMSDESPGEKNPTAQSDTDYENQRPIGRDRMRSVKMMEANWDMYDDSPKRPSVAPPPSGARNAYTRSWDVGEE